MNEVEPKIKIENISGRAFLAFPDQTEMLLTEMIERLHIVSKPTHIYGDLLYFADIDTTSPLPYWAKTTMLAYSSPSLYGKVGVCAEYRPICGV